METLKAAFLIGLALGASVSGFHSMASVYENQVKVEQKVDLNAVSQDVDGMHCIQTIETIDGESYPHEECK